jgi:hypothetical protein
MESTVLDEGVPQSFAGGHAYEDRRAGELVADVLGSHRSGVLKVSFICHEGPDRQGKIGGFARNVRNRSSARRRWSRDRFPVGGPPRFIEMV